MKKALLLLLLCIGLRDTVLEVVVVKRTDDKLQLVGRNMSSEIPLYGAAVADGDRIITTIWEYDKVYYIDLDRETLEGHAHGAAIGRAVVYECDSE